MLALLLMGATAWAGERLSFNRDVRPILGDKCLHCHGPDANARQADLRLDDAANLLHRESPILVPGKPGESELYLRITSTDESLRMPPSDQQRQLTPAETETLRRWIEQGAEYESHWSFIPPARPQAPPVDDASWPRNAIDRFVLARLKHEGLQPSPEAERATLIRRVTLDLTGLPPTPAEVDCFLADDSPDAYEKLVDRLLASPHYGERMGLVWLDAARFADSGGYQGDILRSMWPWRDWVIAAFNCNQPFDEFTVEQLAGDLLPDPTLEQKIATGFNRNHRINDEDGIILEEFRLEYVVDRVETTSAVWMGLTVGCARCHDHKYDPVSQREFYALYAYFNSVAEIGRGHGNAPPLLSLPSTAQQDQLAELDRQISELQSAPEPDATALKSLTKQKQQLAAAVPTLMVMQDLPEPRETFVLVRGAYDQPGEKVTAGVPAALPPVPAEAPANRLTLARWLVDPGHPLTARVAVNRFWQTYFGTGLVATPEDFGSQGSPPSHPDLLDWLATEFVQTGWDIKRMQRLIVTSATYRQSSAASREGYYHDPDNRLLSRGPRFRLPAELLRDQALAAAGLLERAIGGPSVKPYQPEGLWQELASASTEYGQSHGRDLYRRSLYTFVRRTVPPPSMIALDMPNREICTVRRPRTNTPIQALVLMNDTTFVEAARVLAEHTLRETAADPEARITSLYRRVLAREPTERELRLVGETLRFHLERYRAEPERAAQLMSVGEYPDDAALDAAELAAYTAIANLLMNLDETLTKE